MVFAFVDRQECMTLRGLAFHAVAVSQMLSTVYVFGAFVIKENYFALSSGYYVHGNAAYGKQANFSPSRKKKQTTNQNDIEYMENDYVINYQV